MSAKVLKAIVESQPSKIDIINEDIKDIVIRQTVEAVKTQQETESNIAIEDDLTDVVAEIIVKTDNNTASKLIEEVSNVETETNLSLKVIAGISEKSAEKFAVLAETNKDQVEKLTKEDQLDLAKNKILLADQEIKKKGLLLKAEQALNAEALKNQQIKSTELTAGDRIGLLGLSSKANKLSGKAEGVISADKQKAINAKLLPSTEMLRPAARGIQQLDKNVRNLGKVSKITGKNFVTPNSVAF